MLDLLTLFSAVGLQQEMGESSPAKLVIREDEGHGQNLAEEAAEHLSSAFDALEGALSSGIGSLLGASSSTEQTPAAPRTAKKVA
mmetsp:Transcript_19082/g.43414  ORF Transcript_19082/g.43414 Transcript_19082/m.43414 type:complete len:85 (+) Transcript_19082:127-381(+)